MKALTKTRYWNRGLAILATITIALSQSMAANPVPGTVPDDLALLHSISIVATPTPLAPVYSESGALSLSLDGMGTLGATGAVSVLKPVGATVRKAFLGSATTGSSLYQLAAGDVKINGSDVVFTLATQNTIDSFNYWGDVTA